MVEQNVVTNGVNLQVEFGCACRCRYDLVGVQVVAGEYESLLMLVELIGITI
jgi:hypothetical protein